MRRFARCLPLLSLLVSAVGSRSAAAQTVGTLSATAAVIPALTVTGTADLAFGTVASSQVKTVGPAAGGTFTVNGASNTPVGITFGLPVTLGHPAVVIGAWTGRTNGTPSFATSTAMVPSAAPQSFTLSASGRLFVWIGATLTTTLAPTGSYSVPLTVTVVYN